MAAPRSMSLREAKARLSEAVDAAQGAFVLITRHGRPAAVLLGVEGRDVLDVMREFEKPPKPRRRRAA
jgi:prevent-host-death family protein